MIVEPADREIVKWAVDRLVPWYYTRERGLDRPCLSVHFGHVTAYFCRGRLKRIRTHSDADGFDDMFSEFLVLFELCGQSRTVRVEDIVDGRAGSMPDWGGFPRLA